MMLVYDAILDCEHVAHIPNMGYSHISSSLQLK